MELLNNIKCPSSPVSRSSMSSPAPGPRSSTLAFEPLTTTSTTIRHHNYPIRFRYSWRKHIYPHPDTTIASTNTTTNMSSTRVDFSSDFSDWHLDHMQIGLRVSASLGLIGALSIMYDKQCFLNGKKNKLY